jgi:hypothetical protein
VTSLSFNKYNLSKKKAALFGLLAVFIIVMGYVVYVDVGNTIKSSSQSSTSKPVVNQLIPPAYPNNPTNYPLVTNYTIIIPNGLYSGGDIPQYKVFMRFIAPLPSLQSQEKWTIENYTVNRVPFPFTTWARNSSTYSDSYTIAEILPAVFNGTTIAVTVNVYGYNGFNVQLVYSTEWNVTEYFHT